MPPLNWLWQWVTPSYPHPHDPNPAEEAGLFPGTYTRPATPSTRPPSVIVPPSSGPADKSPAAPLPDIEQTLLQPRPEDSGHSSTTESTAPNQSTTGANGEVMRATMTVVEQAHSSRDEPTDHETYYDTDTDADGQVWPGGARQNPSERAKAIEKLQDATEGPRLRRPIVPPIDVELSFDSSDEGDGPSGGPSSNDRSQYPHIPEEGIATLHGHVDHNRSYSPSIQPSERFIVPSPVSSASYPESEIDEGDHAGVATATSPRDEQPRAPGFLPSRVSPFGVRGISNGNSDNDAEGAGVIPSPAASLNGHQRSYSISSVTPSTRLDTSSPLSSTRNADISANRKPRNVHPVEWTVEEVVDWLRSKGFDEMVCDKFTEQDITGDILFELDSATLKSEIGIIAFGIRKRIANAITDMRRRPSILSSSPVQHFRPRSTSHESSLAKVGFPLLPTSRDSPIWPRGSTPDLGESTGRFVPVRRDTDPGMRPIRNVRSRRRSDGTVSNRRTRSNAIVGNGERPRVTSNARNRQRVTSNTGTRSNVTLSNGPSSPISNGGNRSSATSNVLSAISNGGNPTRNEENRSNAVIHDGAPKNLVTKLRGFLFGPPSSTSSKFPSPHVPKEAVQHSARQRR